MLLCGARSVAVALGPSAPGLMLGLRARAPGVCLGLLPGAWGTGPSTVDPVTWGRRFEAGGLEPVGVWCLE
eukprot:1243545-Alexandrium_andersonii.AAC.1